MSINISPEGAKIMLEEAASLANFIKINQKAGPGVIGLYESLRDIYNAILASENKSLKKFLEINAELVSKAEKSLNDSHDILEKAGFKLETVEHFEIKKMDTRVYDELLNDCANLIVNAEKASKLYDELNVQRNLGRLDEYLNKYKKINEQVANYVTVYLRYEQGYQEILKEIEYVKNNIEKIRKAGVGLTRMRNALRLLLNLGIVPAGYKANLDKVKIAVDREVPLPNAA